MGTNTCAKLIGIWSLLFCTNFLGLKHLQVLRDSQVIINWALGKAQVKSLELNHWLENIKNMMNEFTWLSFNHVCRELNKEAYCLSKLDLGVMDGRIQFSIYSAGSVLRAGHLVIFQ